MSRSRTPESESHAALAAEVRALRADQAKRASASQQTMMVILFVLSVIGGFFLPLLWVVSIALVIIAIYRAIWSLVRAPFRR